MQKVYRVGCTLDVLLDDDQLLGQVKTDLARRFPHTPDRGRHSTPVEAILRLLLVKHLHNWSFQETEERVADLLRYKFDIRHKGLRLLRIGTDHFFQRFN